MSAGRLAGRVCAANVVELLTSAWHGDLPMTLSFPAMWDVSMIGRDDIPPLDGTAIRDRIAHPLGTKRLFELASERKRAVILVDDITRPTPAADLLPPILSELERGGIGPDSTTIVIAGGAHHKASPEEICKKVGERVAREYRVVPHDPECNLVFLGKTILGTPVYVNRIVAESDLRVGVGSICPHEWSGFSGGAKIFAPGVCGTSTIRHLHDYFRGARFPGQAADSEIRREIAAVGALMGPDFIVDVVLNHRRETAELVAGDVLLAYRKGAEAASVLYGANAPGNADVVVADAYPFDVSLHYVCRAFHPFSAARRGATKVLVAGCPQGKGYHELGPVTRSFASRIVRRLKAFRFGQGGHLAAAVNGLRRKRVRRGLDFLLYCPGISGDDLKAMYPAATLYRRWEDLADELVRRHGTALVSVAVYRCAPLLLMGEAGKDGG